jgi:selenocysteine-specific elongation factor
MFTANPHSPPSIKECASIAGEDVYNALVDTGELIPLNSEVVFRFSDYVKIVEKIKIYIQQDGQISVAQVRDYLDTSRRYVLALLEHLDSIGMTVRDGDFRKLK